MAQIKIKRAYEEPSETDGFRIFVDRLWPRGIKKEAFHYDLWEKEIAPSNELRKWFHHDPDSNWNEFVARYKKELENNKALKELRETIKGKEAVTLLYGAKDEEHNQAVVLKNFLDRDYTD